MRSKRSAKSSSPATLPVPDKCFPQSPEIHRQSHQRRPIGIRATAIWSTNRVPKSPRMCYRRRALTPKMHPQPAPTRRPQTCWFDTGFGFENQSLLKAPIPFLSLRGLREWKPTVQRTEIRRGQTNWLAVKPEVGATNSDPTKNATAQCRRVHAARLSSRYWRRPLAPPGADDRASRSGKRSFMSNSAVAFARGVVLDCFATAVHLQFGFFPQHRQ